MKQIRIVIDCSKKDHDEIEGNLDVILTQLRNGYQSMEFSIETDITEKVLGIDQATGEDETIISIVDPNKNIKFTWALEKKQPNTNQAE